MKQARRRFLRWAAHGVATLPIVAATEAQAATWQKISSGSSSLTSATATRIRAIAASTTSKTALVLRTDGQVYGVGQTTQGMLGTTTTVTRLMSAITGLSGVKALSAGGGHALFLLNDGTVRALGRNTYGQLGNASTANSSTPVTSLVSNVVAVAAGDQHSLFLHANGTVSSCGYSALGCLAQADTVPATGGAVSTPALMSYESTGAIKMKTMSNVVGIAAGTQFSLAVDSDGQGWGTGSNINKQFSNKGGGADLPLFDTVQGLSQDIAGIAAGAEHSVFMKTGGTVSCEGNSASSRLVTTGITTAISVSAGNQHTVFLTADGSVWSVGNNTTGVIGVGNTTTPTAPTKMLWQSNIVSIAAGDGFTLLLDADGALWGVGDNSSYQLADGTNKNRQFATAVKVEWS